MLNVTKPFLPPLDEVQERLAQIWKSSILTNGGAMHAAFEASLCEHLDVRNLSLYSNGTLALKAAIKILGLSGEVITTPYSFVATANVLVDCGIKPVFVDIDPLTFNLDPSRIEEKITNRTSAIMPVHVYGCPCDVQRIERVASKHNLSVVYDAAHAFGVKVGERSVLDFGDASALSFHSTKVFHTVEGGALALRDADLKNKSDQYKNFGFTDEVSVEYFGINAKLNEIQAAIGLVNLDHIDQIIDGRRRVFQVYNNNLCYIDGIKIPFVSLSSQNYSYYPILIEDKFPMSRDELYGSLRAWALMLEDTSSHLYPTSKCIGTLAFQRATCRLRIASRAAFSVCQFTLAWQNPML